MQWRPLQQATAVRMQGTIDSGVPSPNLHIYYTIPTSKPQRTAPKMGRKIVPARGPRHCCESIFFCIWQRHCTDKSSTIQLPEWELNSDSICWCANMDGRSLTRPEDWMSRGAIENCWEGALDFPRDEPSVLLSNIGWSSLKCPYMINTKFQKVVFMYLLINILKDDGSQNPEWL